MSAIADSSIWIEHLKSPVAELSTLLDSESAFSHSSIIGELALGSIRNRNQFLGNLKLLPRAKEASQEEVLALIEEKKLFGRGLSLVDAQILASAMLSDIGILTRDKALLSAMNDLGLG